MAKRYRLQCTDERGKVYRQNGQFCHYKEVVKLDDDGIGETDSFQVKEAMISHGFIPLEDSPPPAPEPKAKGKGKSKKD